VQSSALPPILAVIPAHNEAPRVGAVVRGASAQLRVLVVDDGSTDETAAVARDAGAMVLVQHPNQGKGAALRAGFRRAIAHGCEAVVTLDADGQHDPADLPGFLEAWKRRRADLIVGARDFAQIPPIRRLANELGTAVFSWAVGQRIPDNQSGYRLVSRRLMEAVLGSGEAGFEFEVEMITTCIRAGYALEWVPIRTIYAGEPSHIRPWHHVTSFLGVALRARRTVRTPLDHHT
jgi:glycosyltransferase involved in cell wall biosynthesis